MGNAKMEYKGNDIDEAINNACVSLKAKREDLEIEIVSTGSVGIFGLGKKKAVIRVSLRSGGEPGKPKGKAVERKAPKAREVVERKVAAGAGAVERKAAETPEGGRRAAEAKAVERKKRPVVDEDEEVDRDDINGEPLTAEELETIRVGLSQLLDLMGCPARTTVTQDAGNKVLARIEEGDMETIIGPEGQTLDGLQYVLRKLTTRAIPKKVVLALDAGTYREIRQQELEERALALAAEVKATGKTRMIPAINPAERRIVHLILQPDSDIRSRSVGDGLFKKVLIYPPGAKGGRRRRPPRRRRGNAGPRDNS